MRSQFFRFIVKLLLTYTLTFSFASAQEISDEHFIAARDALIASDSLKSLDEILPQIANDAKTLFIRSNPDIIDEINKTTDEVALEMVSRRADLDRAVIKIWADRFSIEELNKIEDFFESDVGIKLNELTSEINFQTFNEAEHWQEQISAELYQKVRYRLIGQGLLEE